LGDVTDLTYRSPRTHLCKDCDKWYGQEDDEYGACSYKNLRKQRKYVTYGYHECDEVEELRLRVERWRAGSASSR